MTLLKVITVTNNLRMYAAKRKKHCYINYHIFHHAKAYTTLVRPTLEYASTIWDPHCKKNIDKLQSIQRRAARSVFNDWTRPGFNDSIRFEATHGSPTVMQQQLKWSSLQERRAQSKLLVLHKILNDSQRQESKLTSSPSSPQQ